MTPTQEQLQHSTDALLIALAARNLETGNHCPRVSSLALRLGREVGLTGNELNDLKFGSLLHDVGKIKTPDTVLCKPAQLTPEEWKTMREHPVTGAHMLRKLEYPEAVCLIVEQHHERFDGQGYPFGLSGTEISLGARIFSIADTFDAIVSDRCYRTGQSPAVALHEISSWSGAQFDPDLVEAFVQTHWPEHQKTRRAVA
jgi:putative nucleotidyltransferase with HDIG domain